MFRRETLEEVVRPRLAPVIGGNGISEFSTRMRIRAPVIAYPTRDPANARPRHNAASFFVSFRNDRRFKLPVIGTRVRAANAYS